MNDIVRAMLIELYAKELKNVYREIAKLERDFDSGKISVEDKERFIILRAYADTIENVKIRAVL